MNILLLSYDYPPQSGGIAKVSYHVAEQLDRLEENVFVVAQSSKGDREFDKANKFSTKRCVNIFFLRELALIFLLPFLCLRHRIDIIYVLVWTQGGLAAFLTSRLLKVPYVLHAHGTEFVDYKRTALDRIKYGFLRRNYKRLVLKNARRLIAVSNFTKEMVIKLGARPDAVEVVYNGVDINRFRPGLPTAEIIAKYKLQGKRVLLTASRLKKYKGHDIVINLMPQLLQRFPNLVYLITGSGEDREFLESIVKKLNLQENVIFAGHVDNLVLPLYYSACDVFIMLSREMMNSDEFEGFGLVFLEANSCGKPVIGAKTGGIADAIIDQKTGYLVNLDNHEEIKDRIISLLENRELAASLGKEGRQRIIREGLTWESIGKKVQAILLSEIRK